MTEHRRRFNGRVQVSAEVTAAFHPRRFVDIEAMHRNVMRHGLRLRLAQLLAMPDSEFDAEVEWAEEVIEL